MTQGPAERPKRNGLSCPPEGFGGGDCRCWGWVRTSISQDPETELVAITSEPWGLSHKLPVLKTLSIAFIPSVGP